MPWAIKHICDNRLDGHREWFEGRHQPGVPVPDVTLSGCHTLIFERREDARAYISARHGYLRTSPDLRVEPFCWRMPRAVRVNVSIAETLFKKRGEMV